MPLTIVCDLDSPPLKKLLARRVAPHRIHFLTSAQSHDLTNRKANAAFARADITIGQTSPERLAASPRLRWLHITSAGFTRYDTPEFRAAAQARRLIVTKSSSVFAESCATHVMAFLLAQCRQLPAALQPDSGREATEERIVGNLSMLRGQRILLVGYGTIAQHLIRILAPFGPSITAARRQPTGKEEVPTIRTTKIAAALAQADHVVDLLPANADSEHFFTAARFRAMKRGAAFYNIGRGSTVDQRALAAALRSGKLAAAWLDATTPEPIPLRHELRKIPTCHITPHIAGTHPTWPEEMTEHFIANLARLQKRQPLHDRVF